MSECINMVARETFPDGRETLTGIYTGPRKQRNLIFPCSLSAGGGEIGVETIGTDKGGFQLF